MMSPKPEQSELFNISVAGLIRLRPTCALAADATSVLRQVTNTRLLGRNFGC